MADRVVLSVQVSQDQYNNIVKLPETSIFTLFTFKQYLYFVYFKLYIYFKLYVYFPFENDARAIPAKSPIEDLRLFEV